MKTKLAKAEMINTPTEHNHDGITNCTSHKQGGEFEIPLAEQKSYDKILWMNEATDRPAFGEIDDLHEDEMQENKQQQQHKLYKVV